MKANAPEKLWIAPETDLPKLSGHIDKDSVEYIRTDAFIEKACAWFNKNWIHYTYPSSLMFEDFKKSMRQ